MAHRPRKRFGQNFLHDKNVLNRIIAAADFQEDDRILEIGPGPGALTTRLLATGLPVLAVEIDRDLGAALQARDEENLDVKIGDTVLFGKYSGTEVKLGDEELVVMREDDVMGVVEG